MSYGECMRYATWRDGFTSGDEAAAEAFKKVEYQAAEIERLECRIAIAVQLIKDCTEDAGWSATSWDKAAEKWLANNAECLAAHDAEVIERALSSADIPMSELREKPKAFEDGFHFVGRRLRDYANHLRTSAEEVNPDRFPDCEIEFGALGTYCKCAADQASAEEVKS